VDLADVDELTVEPGDANAVVSWRHGSAWTVKHGDGDADRLWDAEDVLRFFAGAQGSKFPSPSVPEGVTATA